MVDYRLPRSLQVFGACLISIGVCTGCSSYDYSKQIDHPTANQLELVIEQRADRLQVTLTNRSGLPIAIVRYFQPELGALLLKVVDSSGKEIELWTVVDWGIVRRSDLHILKPSCSYSQDVSLSNYRLEPGEYTVEAEYSVSTNRSYMPPSGNSGWNYEDAIVPDMVRNYLWLGQLKANTIKFLVSPSRAETGSDR
jgi:hypothetical protein